MRVDQAASILHNWTAGHLRQENILMLTDTSDWRLRGRQVNLPIFEVENEIIDFCSDLLSTEESSLSQLDNVVFTPERERNVLKTNNFPCQERLVSVHYTASRSKYLFK